MSGCAEGLENNENIANGCVVVARKNDESKDISTSQDLFSDDDQLKDSAFPSPKLVTKNDTLNSSTISIKTPILCSKVAEVTPGRAVVPRTPADLLPFITKTSVLWTSDMETPEGKLNDKTENSDVTINSEVGTNNTTPKREKCSLNCENKMDIASSPVLGGKKRAKRKVKRRILNAITLDTDNNNDQQSTSGSSDKVTSETSSVNTEPFFDIKSEMKLNIIQENSKSNNEECKENKLEKPTAFDKNSNTSTQDFFSNVSFTSIDRLCCNVISEDKNSIPGSENKENNVVVIKQEIIEEDTKPIISNDVLERVAAIKRNQKPLRRSVDISHTVIPKEEFCKSVRELELADAKFSQEKKKSSMAQHQPLRLMSFSELTSTEKLISAKKEKFPKKENHDVPADIMDDWNVGIFPDTNFVKEEKISPIAASSTMKSEVGFSSANGKEITINEKNLQKCIKMYKEIEKEINSNNDLLALEKSTTNSRVSISKTSKINLKVKNQVDAACTTSEIGFSTANGKNIAISEDKLLDYAKIYNELENENLNENSFLELKNKNLRSNNVQLNFIKNTISKTKSVAKIRTDKKLIVPSTTLVEDKKQDTLKLYEELDLNEFLQPTFTSTNEAKSNDGFITAGGKGIKVNEEKERIYSKLYNELDNIDENSLLNVKKDNALKLVSIAKPKDKAIIKFNNKKPDVSHSHINLSEKTSDILQKEFVSDGFSTAGGKGIKINEEKERLYAKIYNELEDNEESSLISLKPKKTSKHIVEKSKTKAHIVFNDKQFDASNKSSTVIFKKNEVQVNLATSGSLSSTDEKVKTELPEVMSKTNNQSSTSKETTYNCHFTVPNSFNITKKMNEVLCTEKESLPGSKVSDATIQKPSEDQKSAGSAMPANNHLSKLKRKLENCEVKRPERCRSFGGFPGSSNASISSTKMNKSDPYNDSVNQPLQTGLSVSQQFDLHSDSWLSRIELSDLNVSKAKLSEVKMKNDRIEREISTVPSNGKDSEGESENFSGFSYKECTESFKLYANFEKFLKRHIARFRAIRELSIESGHTISISNNTMSRQTLSIHCDCEADLRRGMIESSYVLIDSPVKSDVLELSEDSQNKVKSNEPKVQKADNKMMEKRKHADTDSDTPLTTLKKPRTGSELQGRKLFSDDSDDNEEEVEEQALTENDVDNLIQSLPLPPPQSVELTEEELAELAEMRMDAIMQQEKMIRNKKRMEIKPIMGSLLSERLANVKNRKTWTDYVGSSVPTTRPMKQIKQNHPAAGILEVTASNATCYTFLSSNVIDNKRVVSLELEDNARLIFDEDGHAGVNEFTDAFLAMPGVDPKLVPTGWIENHYRWIVWKLASLDRIHFENTDLPKMLTPDRVMKELKYRYDREIDRAQRPALRKILEKDDAPSRRIVLCVSSIEDTSTSQNADKDVKVMLGLPRFKIEVTDGWYSIPLTIDDAMSNYISIGKIKEGTKLMTYGAILLECERGFFPLDKPDNVSLKIFTNCTRRARWDAKLGYQKNQGPIPVKLRNIIMGGGLIGETTAVAARVYPLLYREKTPDGQSIYRNARSEEKAATAYERALEKKADDIYAQAEKNFDSKKKSNFDDDSQAEHVRGQRNWERKQEELKQQLETEIRQGLPPPRNVTPVLKVRLVDDRTTVILTIWGANEDSACDIKEGNTITVYNCYAMGSRGGELNLTANRQSHIKPEPLLKLTYPMRLCTLIPDIGAMNFDPKFCEFDTVGVVVSTGPAPHGMKNFEILTMAYPKPNNSGSSYLSILFWNGMSSFGYQGFFSTGALIACTNLEWRRATSWSVAVAYCSERTVFTCNPRPQYLNNGIRNLRALIQNPVIYAESCIEEVKNELSKKPLPRSNQGTPTSWLDRSHNSSTFISPMNNHTPSHVTIQKRLEKLSRYGSSTDVSPIVLNNSSVRVKKDFTPVTRKNT